MGASASGITKMIDGIVGKKVGMTHVYSADGAMVPVTVIKTGNTVVQRKTNQKDGYDAVQVGFLEKKEKRVNKPLQGHFKKAGTASFYHLVEVKGTELDSYKPGTVINAADVFKAGDWVDVSGKSKGKGFMGSMRRHHFKGGSESHGSMHNRAPGSIGSSSDPSRVFKGMKMAGHMGAADVTVQNLQIVSVKAEENLLLVKGAVPGAINAVVVIKKALKK